MADADLAALLAGLEGGGEDALADLLGAESEPEPASPLFEPAPYRCVRRTLVRGGFDTFTTVIGALEPGDAAEILEKRTTESGVVRLRFVFMTEDGAEREGWISLSGAAGEFVVPATSDDPPPPSAAAPAPSAPAAPAEQPKSEASSAVASVEMTTVSTDSTATMLGTAKVSVFHVVCIAVERPPWTARRTYKQFATLRDELTTKVVEDRDSFSALKFPPTVWMNETAPKTSSMRRRVLLEWLTACLRLPEAKQPVAEFLQESVDAPKAEEKLAVAPTPTLAAAATASGPEEQAAAAATSIALRKVTVQAVDDDEAYRREDTMYQVTVDPRSEELAAWTVEKRYSDFATLRSALTGAGAALKAFPFPVQRVYSRIRNQFDQKAAVEREEGLNLWLGNVIAMRGSDPNLQKFVAQAAPTDASASSTAAGSTSDADKAGSTADIAAPDESWGLTSVLSSILGAKNKPSAVAVARPGPSYPGLASATDLSVHKIHRKPRDEEWAMSPKFLTPGSATQWGPTTYTQQPPPAAAEGATYHAGGSSAVPGRGVLLSTTAVNPALFRPTPVYHPFGGKSLLASISGGDVPPPRVNVLAVRVAAYGADAYELHCLPKEGFGWRVLKRWEEFVAVREDMLLEEEDTTVLQGVIFPQRKAKGIFSVFTSSSISSGGSGQPMVASADIERWLRELLNLEFGLSPALTAFLCGHHTAIQVHGGVSSSGGAVAADGSKAAVAVAVVPVVVKAEAEVAKAEAPAPAQKDEPEAAAAGTEWV